MILYQIVAYGPKEIFSGTKAIYSKRVFQTREAAEEYAPSFLPRCTDKTEDIANIDPEHIKFKVVELELMEN